MEEKKPSLGAQLDPLSAAQVWPVGHCNTSSWWAWIMMDICKWWAWLAKIDPSTDGPILANSIHFWCGVRNTTAHQEGGGPTYHRRVGWPPPPVVAWWWNSIHRLPTCLHAKKHTLAWSPLLIKGRFDPMKQVGRHTWAHLELLLIPLTPHSHSWPRRKHVCYGREE
jgi:hypothetical protein